MEINASLENVNEESFSKKEVTFCDKSSILYYGVEETVNSLNDSVIHTISNDNFPLTPEFSNMLQNSSVNSQDKYASDQYLYNLPKAVVVLERLPEALLHKHTYSSSATECCLMPNVPQNVDEASSLKSDSSHQKTISEAVVNQKNSVLKEIEYSLRDLKVLIPQLPFKDLVSGSCSVVDACIENSSGKTSKLKIVNDAKAKSEETPGKLSVQYLNKTDVIHQSSLQNSFAEMSLTDETETSEFLYKNSEKRKDNKKSLTKTVFLMNKTLPPNKTVNPKTVNLSTPVINTENNSTSSSAISAKEIAKQPPMIMGLFTHNISSNDNSVLYDHKNSPSDISILNNECIVKDTSCHNSIPYKNVLNKYPVVLLQRLNLPLSKSDSNYCMNSKESIHVNLVPAVTDESDLPIQINNICSISIENFNGIQKKLAKTSTKDKNSQVKSNKHKKKNSILDCSAFPNISALKRTDSKSQKSSNKIKKKGDISAESKKNKKHGKRYLRKKQEKVYYKMIMKYLKLQIKLEKQRKSRKKKNRQEKTKNVESVNLVSSNSESDAESADSVTLVYDSTKQEHSYALNNSFEKNDEASVQCEKVWENRYIQRKKSVLKENETACHGESSSLEKTNRARKHKKSMDKYRLGFLSNKLSLRFYNRFSASERLLLSECKLKKKKKRELKRLFSRLKAASLMSLK